MGLCTERQRLNAHMREAPMRSNPGGNGRWSGDVEHGWRATPRLNRAAKESSLQPSEDREDLLVVGLVACVLEHFAVPHDAVPAEHEHGALRDALEPDHVFIE